MQHLTTERKHLLVLTSNKPFPLLHNKMSIEGGAFKCFIHDFETSSIDEWNDHCYGDDEHTESGRAICISCGKSFMFEGLPFHKLGPDGSKGISLRCEECETKTLGKVKRSATKK